MGTILKSFIFSAITGALFCWLVMLLARRFGFVDRPDGYRKLHIGEIPRLGGVGIFAGFSAPLLILWAFPEVSQVSRLVYADLSRLGIIMLGALLILAVGVFDDVKGLRARYKLLAQIVVAAIVFTLGFRIDVVSNPFGEPLVLGIFALPVTVFWLVGCMNAVNLLDGIDGLAAGICLFVCITLMLLNVVFENLFAVLLMSCLGGAIFSFLLYNFPPAKMFMGDSGSLLLGYMIAVLSIVGGTRKAETAIALFVPVVALGVPILDTSIAIVRRWYKRLPISSPDRDHIHHVLVKMGYSNRRAVLTLYLISLLFGAAALLITFARNELAILVMGALAVTAFVSIRLFAGVRLHDLLAKMGADQRQSRMAVIQRELLHRCIGQISTAESFKDAWDECLVLFTALELKQVDLTLNDMKNEDRNFFWINSQPGIANKNCKNGDVQLFRLILKNDDIVIGEIRTVLCPDAQQLAVNSSYQMLSELRDHLAAKAGGSRCEQA